MAVGKVIRRWLLASLATLVLAPYAAFAASYGDIAGTDVLFENVNETTQSPGDPDGLFGGVMGPQVSGNQLLFFPTEFSASTAGDGGADLTASLLNLTLQSTNADFFIKELKLTEFGSVDRLEKALRQAPLFREITVGDITGDARRGGTTFSVRISLAPPSRGGRSG